MFRIAFIMISLTNFVAISALAGTTTASESFSGCYANNALSITELPNVEEQPTVFQITDGNQVLGLSVADTKEGTAILNVLVQAYNLQADTAIVCLRGTVAPEWIIAIEQVWVCNKEQVSVEQDGATVWGCFESDAYLQAGN